MEDLTPLEDFHQYLLFKLMDEELNQHHTYIAIDKDGCIYTYACEPKVAGVMWGLSHNDYSTVGFFDWMTIPKGYTFKDCKWKL